MKLLLVIDQAFLLYFTRTARISQTKIPLFPKIYQKYDGNGYIFTFATSYKRVGELMILFVLTKRFII
ncbi:hypothetical protein AB432_024575 [Brevibacillus brevis]|uniref:Uncharacterized protein n=1 Tax=Brevibacillus brevis TaxID=1393 RepID=A0A2Z4MNA2_BREBE|nr:hypothetical protein AB432_024575 [Brevibacillus brevis]RAT98053.1 hypothetical protein ASG16_007795 [Brevibacillus sp. Leaf182]